MVLPKALLMALILFGPPIVLGNRFKTALLVGSSALSIALQSAIELVVFDIIAREGPGTKLSSSEIAAKIGTKNSEAPMMMDRIFRPLTSHSDENGASDFQRVYSLGPVSKYFVNDEEGGSLGPLMTLTQDKVFTESWLV
ncbi:hypothetical protein ACE6H2_008111 [Prunus campanulata]